MSSPNSLITAPQQAGNAPMCSGSTTCCATTSPFAFISAQEASCDSRTMVEKPVRNSEFCISCTMPERLALTTSRSTASIAGVRAASFRFPASRSSSSIRRRARSGRRRSRWCSRTGRGSPGPCTVRPDVEPLALIDRAFDVAPSKRTRRVSRSASASVAPVGLKRGTRPAARGRGRARDRTRSRPALLGRAVAEHALVLRVECAAQRRRARRPATRLRRTAS